MCVSVGHGLNSPMHNPAIHHEDTQVQNKQSKANSSKQAKQMKGKTTTAIKRQAKHNKQQATQQGKANKMIKTKCVHKN
jgi:hypothetical protein